MSTITLINSISVSSMYLLYVTSSKSIVTTYMLNYCTRFHNVYMINSSNLRLYTFQFINKKRRRFSHLSLLIFFHLAEVLQPLLPIFSSFLSRWSSPSGPCPPTVGQAILPLLLVEPCRPWRRFEILSNDLSSTS
jgi:hypothetical protein